MSNVSRRSLLGAAVGLPLATVGIGRILAQGDSDTDSTPDASPQASPGASPVATPDAGGAADGEEVTVVAVDIDFEPNEFTIPADTDVTIVLDNQGNLDHDFVIDDLDFVIGPISGGETASDVLNAPAGEYEYYCSIPGHSEAGMVGTLIVE